MKKIILLALTALIMVGCQENKKPSPTLYRNKKTGTITAIIDNCEYIVNKEKYAFAHTANAVEGVVHHFEKCGVASVHYNDPTGVPMAYFTSPEGLSAEDKVKIIVIKKD